MAATSPSTEASPSVDGPPTTEVSPSMEASPSVGVPKTTEALPSVDGPKTTEVSSSVDGRRDYCADFLCCICLDLAFKPIVLACGHIGCFWCVLLSMKTPDSSECPICRQPYRHFPRVCGLLHRVLLKVVPEVYKKREREELDKEGEKAAFSQQMPDDMIVQSDYSENLVEVHGHYNLSEEDLLCSECKKMLVKPVVLNCGHVYCQSCLKLECKICQYPRVGQAPKVCLILDNLIQDHFPALYRIRRLKRKLDDIDYQENADLSTEAFQSVLKYSPWSCHSGVGCDVCGAVQIIIQRDGWDNAYAWLIMVPEDVLSPLLTNQIDQNIWISYLFLTSYHFSFHCTGAKIVVGLLPGMICVKAATAVIYTFLADSIKIIIRSTPLLLMVHCCFDRLKHCRLQVEAKVEYAREDRTTE